MSKTDLEKLKEQLKALGDQIVKEEEKEKAKIIDEVEIMSVDGKGRYADDWTTNKKKKKSVLKPSTWFKSDATNPIIMFILSPAGDLTIRECIADQRGNLPISKKVMYRIEPNEIWDITGSDISGFNGRRASFYFQDNPNPVRIRRDDKGVKITVNTETYSKSQKSHLLSELLSPEMTITDYIMIVIVGINLLLTLLVIFKLFFMKGGST